MADKTFKIPPGKTLEINLKRKKRTPPATIAGSDDNAGIIPVESEKTRYVRRDKGSVTFYDLGTRKLEDGSYDYIYLPSVDFSLGSPIAETINAILLAGNPTGESVCRKLPFHAEFLYVDATFKKGAEEKVFMVGERGARPLLRNLKICDTSEAPPLDDGTEWKRDASLSFNPSGWKIGIQAGWYYRPFDTSDTTTYKITNSPDAHGRQVEFKLKAKAQVFLVPSYERISIDAESDFINLGRLPSFPEVEASAFLDVCRGPDAAQATATDAQVTMFTSFLGAQVTVGSYVGWSAINTWPNVCDSVHPIIVAIIKTGSDTFYVWEREAPAETRLWELSLFTNIFG